MIIQTKGRFMQEDPATDGKIKNKTKTSSNNEIKAMHCVTTYTNTCVITYLLTCKRIRF